MGRPSSKVGRMLAGSALTPIVAVIVFVIMEATLEASGVT